MYFPEFEVGAGDILPCLLSHRVSVQIFTTFLSTRMEENILFKCLNIPNRACFTEYRNLQNTQKPLQFSSKHNGIQSVYTTYWKFNLGDDLVPILVNIHTKSPEFLDIPLARISALVWIFFYFLSPS